MGTSTREISKQNDETDDKKDIDKKGQKGHRPDRPGGQGKHTDLT